MKRFFCLMLFMLSLGSCRAYDLEARLTDQDGLVSAERFARYGREQAQSIAVAREYARARAGRSPEDLEKQGEAAITYARTLPDVTDILADPPGYRVSLRLRSGWLTMVNPVDDGKAGAETPGFSGKPAAAQER